MMNSPDDSVIRSDLQHLEKLFEEHRDEDKLFRAEMRSGLTLANSALTNLRIDFTAFAAGARIENTTVSAAAKYIIQFTVNVLGVLIAAGILYLFKVLR